MGENEPVKDSTCQERMASQNANIQLMFSQIQRDISDIKADVKALSTSTSCMVSWEAFRERTREYDDYIKSMRADIETNKKFIYRMTGALIALNVAAGLVIKLL